jgi:2'-5' RNA ligase
MDIQLPGKSLDTQFGTLWDRFSALPMTNDSMATWRIRLRRWLTPINVSFIVPIDDDEICNYLSDAQRRLAPLMHYAPQPKEKLHITLYLVGYLRAGLAFRYTWTREELHTLAERAAILFKKLPNFTVRVGPINAFPNVAIAEVRDEGQLRLLERAAASLIPESRRMPEPYTLLPHITLGYWGQRPVPPIAGTLKYLREWPILPLQVNRAALTLYYRGLGNYSTENVLHHSIEEIIGTLPLNRREG